VGDLAGQSGLRNTKGFGRAAKMELVRHFPEVDEMANFEIKLILTRHQ